MEGIGKDPQRYEPRGRKKSHSDIDKVQNLKLGQKLKYSPIFLA